VTFDRLSAKEMGLIKQICTLWKDKRTPEIVNFTHEQKPWKICRDGEYIPYSLIIQEDPDHVYQPTANNDDYRVIFSPTPKDTY